MSYDELFNNLRQKLDVLGYHQPLPLAAVPLAGALFEDLVKTTESLRDAKFQLSNLLEEKSCWELGVEPYKCDNSRLLAECNALHLELIKQRDNFDEQICDYARKIRNLESDKRCLEDHCIELEGQIRDLHLRYTDAKSIKSKKDGVNMSKKPFITTVRTGTLLPNPLLDQPHPSKCAKCNSILWARQPGGSNSTEIERLQNDVREKADQAALYKKKVDEREREIRRLNDLLTGGRPPPALAKDCCYKNVGTLSEDVEKLQKDKVENCHIIRELQESMHEAKQRAVDLAERNKMLERELKEFKDAALSVEQQANEEIAKKETEISQLCDEIRKLKRQRPDSIERRPDRSSDEKRRLNERLNEMIQREKELEAEIDRMTVKNCKLKSKVALLQKDNEEKQHREDKSVSTEVDEERIRLKSERDLFQKEYLRLVEKSGSSQEVCMLRTQLKEKEDELKNLRSELCHLRTQTGRSSYDKTTPPSTSISVQAAIIRAERERDVAKADIDRVKAERDLLREKLQYSTDAQFTETDRFRGEVQALNARICQLEQENRDLLSSKIPGQTHIILLKEEMEELKKRLCEVQNENCQLNTRHNQLKLLHEQTERALVDYQNKHAISETNLRNAESRLGTLTTNRDTTRSEVHSLQNEISVLKSANATLEGEKDKILNDLDKKTEKLYRAENELQLLKKKKEELEYTVQALESRLDKVTSERRVRENELHETSTESKTLRQQISTLKEIRDQTIAENGRISNELADAKADNSLTKKKLRESEKEVDRLKQQLQQYVQKVQRAEDLLMQKEHEREEMLDHYRTLSHDAIMLEGNNQSLEMEAAEHKRQLLEAEEEIARLKQDISIKDCTIQKLEKQVSHLSTQICRLEKDLEQAYDDQKLLKADLDAIKELCEKLDFQSEKQNAELKERGEIISKLEKENSELRNNSPSSPSGKATTDILQDLLVKSRQELEEERKSLCKLAQEKLDLRKTIEEMQKKLETEREKAMQKEALAKEYSVQIQEMQHNLTDDRFQKARSREQSPRSKNPRSTTFRLSSGYSPSSCNQSERQERLRGTCADRNYCMDTSNVCSNYSTNLCSTVEDICDHISPSFCQDTVCTSSYGCAERPQDNCSSSANTCCSASRKSNSKESSLKSMKSILKKVDPCKRANLLEDVRNYLGGNSCSYEERISFDEDSDDIIVRRKRNVETKRIRGDKLSSDTWANMLSSSTRTSSRSPKRSRDKKISCPKNVPVSDTKSSRSQYLCQGQTSSKIKTKEKKKSSYSPRISQEVNKSEKKSKPTPASKSKTTALSLNSTDSTSSSKYSKNPRIESICRECIQSSDSTSSTKYSKDPNIESICRQICAMAPTCRPIPKEEMCLKPYIKGYSKYASKTDTTKTDSKDRRCTSETYTTKTESKDRRCTSGTYTTKTESKSSTFYKRSPSPLRSKKCVGDTVTKNKKEINERERECKSKSSRSASPLPSVKQKKEMKPLKTKSEVLKNKREATTLAKQKAASGDNIKMKRDKEQADKKPEVEKCTKKEPFDYKEEYYDACALGPKPADLTNNSECENETIGLVQDFCERMKTAIERQPECSSVVELKQKMDQICVEDTVKNELDLKPSTSKEISQSPLRPKKCIRDAGLKNKKGIDENCGQERKSKCCPLPAKQEKEENPLKTKSEILKTKREASVLTKKKAVSGDNIKMKVEKGEVDKKPKIQRCTKRESFDDTEEYYDVYALGPQSTSINAQSGNVCKDETTALVQDFCARIKTVIEKQAECPAVAELKPKLDQICFDAPKKDEQAVAGRTYTAFSPKAASTFIEGKDNRPAKEACARRASFPPTFKVCGCMKQRCDRLQSILTDGKDTTRPKDIGYYRQSIISRRSNDRLEQTIVEHGGDGGSFDVSLLPPPPIYEN